MDKRTSRRPLPPRPHAKTASKLPAPRKSIVPNPTVPKGAAGAPATVEDRLAACRDELAATRDEVARLVKRVERLEAKLDARDPDRARRRPPPLPADDDGGTIDVTEVAELVEPTRRSRA